MATYKDIKFEFKIEEKQTKEMENKIHIFGDERVKYKTAYTCSMIGGEKLERKCKYFHLIE